ncbi:bifunctional nicotinamidase/pyrazinamidase [Fusobacterium sp.]|uniref:bifunctional nicotinamidase/pyrazinamidase n=1 Tax=Fusobacterium sp. TaxID=68766 RepID=UPI0025C04D1E|nr:bifunctional nicotinamidase/pyrazinamidase [Fusobacterium sp.]
MKALILVDLQNDFCKDGALEVKNGDETISVANFLMNKFSQENSLILATKDWHPSSHKSFAINSNGTIGEVGTLNGVPQVWWPVHCVENTKGSEFHPDLNKDLISTIIYKGTNPEIDSYSGFFDNGRLNETTLNSILKDNKIDTLYILGLATDFCVKFTVLDALQLGYNVYLVEDGCRGVNLEADSSIKAIEEMKNCGATIVKSIDLF